MTPEKLKMLKKIQPLFTDTNPADILNRMRERDDWYKFIYKIGFDTTGHEIYNGSQIEYINIEYILNPSTLLRKAIEFLENK